MNTKPIIGIAPNYSYEKKEYTLSEDYVLAIEKAGGCPIVLLHHQSCSTLGEGFIVSARSADGLIEAIEHKDNRFAVGVQWHPEAMKTEEMGLLFSAFLKAAAEYQQARR